MITTSGAGIGIVETETLRVFEDGLELDCGRRLESVTVAFEQYGAMSAARDNVILVCHALSGGAHAAGWHPGARKPGWWDAAIGPGRAFDTDRFCVLCTNVLGSCYGTTGPASPDPGTGRPYGSRFPFVTIADMVRVQKALVDRLGISCLVSVAGGSMGGMQALQWAVSFPETVRSVVALATTHRHSAQQIAFDEIARRALTADPNWRGGEYYDGERPADGLSVARMIGHVTYLSDPGMERKFGRRLGQSGPGYSLGPEFEVERYLDYQGRSFVDRFDANSLVYLSKALDYFDLEAGRRSLADAFEATEAAFLLLTFSSDWLYPPYQLATVAAALRQAGRTAEYRELSSEYGHDAFLLEHEAQQPIVREFLSRICG
ncbi:MAG: homoserine O-acetyltransferase [Acidobacteria bacterium]|nr:homoserine O-acetyltransferase [Acidobacteriota bacterium]